MYRAGQNDWGLDPSHGNFDIRVNGLPAAVTLNALGNLGIGTTSPTARLNVFNGDIQISTNTGSNGIIFQDGSKQTTAATGAQFGGWYCTGSGTISAGGSGSVNPLTGGFSCPAGFTAASMFSFGSGGLGNCSGQCVSFIVSCTMCYK